MNSIFSSITATCLLLSGLNLVDSARGELPDLGDQDWIACFAGHLDSKVRFTIGTKGELLIEPVYEKGQPRAYIKLPVTLRLEETLPNGNKRYLAVDPDSLKSEDEVTDKFKETTIQGSFVGGAAFEVMIEQKRGVVSVGGRLTDPGDYDSKSIRFQVSAQVLNFYGKKKRELENDPKAFEDLVSNDSLKLKKTDGKRVKLDYIEPRTLATEEFNQLGASEAEVDIHSIDRRFLFEASGDSAITFSNRKGAALNEGMLINWSPDSTKDLKAQARFIIEVK